MSYRVSVLKQVFNDLYNRPFDSALLDDRLLLQKTVYLLQQMGMSIGEYRFKWHTYGPFSQGVQDDISALFDTGASGAEEIRFNDYAVQILNQFRALLQSAPEYVIINYWFETIASIHYLVQYCRLPLTGTELLVAEFFKRKPHFSDTVINRQTAMSALELIAEQKEIFYVF